MNSFIVLVILCGIQFSCAEELKCVFQLWPNNFVGTLYSCMVTTLDNQNDSVVMTGCSGVHMTAKSNNDVKAIWIHNTNSKYIPKKLGYLFQFTALTMWSSELIEIKTKDFNGMHKLESLNLGNNELTTLSTDVFSTLTKLKFLNLNYNKIKELKNGMFDTNLNLGEIRLMGNKIKLIESGLFTDLKQLNNVDLRNNVCISKNYNGITEINQLKNDIEINCKYPVQSPMETKIKNLEKELLEVKNKCLTERIEFTEVRNLLNQIIQDSIKNEKF